MKEITILLLLVLPILLHAQENESTRKSQFHMGFGTGIDYGGFGVRGTYVALPSVGVFIGVGYNLNSVGYNVGVQYIIPRNRHQLYFTGMYGYNGVIVVTGDIEDKGTYYGFSGGVGFQLNSAKRSTFWNFELLVPLRNSNFKDDIDTLNAMGADVREPLPIAISIGYHIRIK